MFDLMRLYFYYVKLHMWAWWHGHKFSVKMEDFEGRPISEWKGFIPFLDRRKNE